MKVKHLAAAIVFSSSNIIALAGSNIDAILSNIKCNNTELKVFGASIKSDSANIVTNNNLEDPKVDFGYDFNSDISGNKWEIGVSQGFDWPGTYAARRKANASKTDALRLAYQVKQLDILYQAKTTCLEIIMLNKQIDYQKLILGNMENLYAQYDKAYQHGETSIIDINKLKIERIAARQALNELNTKLSAAKSRLLGLNNNQSFSINLDSLNDYPAEELRSYDTYQKEFANFDPQNSYFSKVEEGIKNDVKVAKLGWFPKFDIGYRYSREDGGKFNGVTVGASIPIFSNRKKVAAAKSLSTTNEMERQNYETENAARIKSKYETAVSLKSQLALYSEVIGDNNNFIVLKKALDGGQITPLDYLLEVRYFLEAKDKYVELEYEYNSALAELNKYHLVQ